MVFVAVLAVGLSLIALIGLAGRWALTDEPGPREGTAVLVLFGCLFGAFAIAVLVASGWEAIPIFVALVAWSGGCALLAVPLSRLYDIDVRIGVALGALLGPVGLGILVYLLGGATLARDGQLPPMDL